MKCVKMCAEKVRQGRVGPALGLLLLCSVQDVAVPWGHLGKVNSHNDTLRASGDGRIVIQTQVLQSLAGPPRWRWPFVSRKLICINIKPSLRSCPMRLAFELGLASAIYPVCQEARVNYCRLALLLSFSMRRHGSSMNTRLNSTLRCLMRNGDGRDADVTAISLSRLEEKRCSSCPPHILWARGCWGLGRWNHHASCKQPLCLPICRVSVPMHVGPAAGASIWCIRRRYCRDGTAQEQRLAAC